MHEDIKAFLRRRREERGALAPASGLTGEDMQALAAAPPHLPDRVLSMARAFGLGREAVRRHGQAYDSLLITCARCPSGDRCDHGFATDRVMTADDLRECRNRAVYEGLLRQL